MASRDALDNAMETEAAKVVGHPSGGIVGWVESQQLRQQRPDFRIVEATGKWRNRACLSAAVLFGKALSASLYGVRATDPLTLAGVIGVLAIVIGIVSAGPALRASKVDLLIALRQD